MCDCVSKVCALVKGKFGPTADVDNYTIGGPQKFFSHIRYKEGRANRRSLLVYNYCPFCGEKYDAPPDSAQQATYEPAPPGAERFNQITDWLADAKEGEQCPEPAGAEDGVGGDKDAR